MLTLTQEVWSPVLGFEGLYEVSTHGRVRSLHKRHLGNGLILRLKTDRYGYKAVRLSRPEGHSDRLVHSLVAEAFIGKRPAGKQVAHANGDKNDNFVANLRYATPLENAADKFVHGTVLRGVDHGRAKLTVADVLEIRSSNLSQSKTAALFGISCGQVSNIRTRKQWGHL